jgi:hypothetical protein
MDELINHFGIVDDKQINCGLMAEKLYELLLNRFHMIVPNEIKQDIGDYSDRVYDFVSNMRQKTTNEIINILEYVRTKSIYLPDIIIMVWCLPNNNLIHTNNKYDEQYKFLIETYNCKMIEIIEHPIMKEFCIEVIPKKNWIPIHCVDYIWHYMNYLDIDFIYYNYMSRLYVGINYDADDVMIIGINIAYVLKQGVGKVNNHLKGSFRNFIYKMMTNVDVVQKMSSNSNFISQMKKINENVKLYFGEDAVSFRDEIVQFLL